MKSVVFQVLALFVFLQLPVAANAEVVFKGTDATKFEFEVAFKNAQFITITETDPFTGVTSLESATAICWLDVTSIYRGEEDFIMKAWHVLDLVLKTKSGQVISHRLSNDLVMNPDQVYKTNDWLNYDVEEAGSIDYTDKPNARQAAKDIAYQCDVENIASIRLDPYIYDSGNITFRSGKELSPSDLIRQSSVSLTGFVKPENVEVVEYDL
jgi:hypothetical protein